MSEQEIYIEVMNRPNPADRCHYLDQACAGNENLRNRVESLIRQSDQLGSFLEHSPHAVAATADVCVAEERIGTLIGPYKLLEQIGEGGMGVVYMAQQTEPVKRKVALKVIKPGMGTKQVIARFEAERQALALMDHPNIARIYDAGTTGEPEASASASVYFPTPDSRFPTPSAGRPYFVMELVRGVPITEYCDKHRPNTHERLRLFLDVCQAVQHAHLKGIIHRDLKPSNVLVTLHDGVPVVKVIDFGVAKALNQELTEKTLFTQFSQMVGTPLYMSPEQAELSGLDIDTRTDVYSLGVLLYELLTGTTPFDKERLKNAGFDEMRRIIREEEPETVSARIVRTRRVGQGRCGRRPTETPPVDSRARSAECGVRNEHTNRKSKIQNLKSVTELDWIAMKSLEKDRSRRYESASALAADIHRYLSDEPVLACPPTTMYRFQKFARKHKPALLTAAAIAVCLLLGTSVSAWQTVRATTAEAQANVNATTAQEKAKEATEQRDQAQKQRDEVTALNEKLQATQAQLGKTLYAAHMKLAQHAWESSDPQQVLELLAQYRPEPGQKDLRGFEWHYLNRLCNSEVLTLKGHSGRPGEVAFSPDGTKLASAGRQEVKVWDAQSGRELHAYQVQKGIWGLGYSPDGKRLVGAGDGVKVWDSETGKQLLSINGGGWKAAFSPDGKRVASGSEDNTVEIWDSETGEHLLSLKGHTQVPAAVAFSPDGQRLASASYDSIVKVWDTNSGQELLSLTASTEYSDDPSVRFSADGKLLAMCGAPRTKVWKADTGELVQTLDAPYANSVAFAPGGTRLITCRPQLQRSDVWDLPTGKHIRAIMGPAAYAALSPDGTRLASASDNNTVKVWDVQKDLECITLPSDGGSIALSPDWSRFASPAPDNTVKIRDAQTGRVLLSLKGHTVPVRRVAYSPDGQYVASGGGGSGEFGHAVGRDDRSELILWYAQTGKSLRTVPMSKGAVFAVAFSPDGRRLAATSFPPPYGEDAMLKIWDVQTGDELIALMGEAAKSASLAFSPDGKRLACSGNAVLDVETGQKLFALEGRSRSLAFTADGKYLATREGQGSIKLLDSTSGQEVQTLKWGRNKWGGLVFSPDSKRIALDEGGVAGGGRKVLILDASTGLEVFSFVGSGDNVIFSQDGYRLACNGPNNTVKIYDATPLPESP